MSFIIFDIIFLALFVIFIIIFLYKNRKKLDREGILFIYRTKWGVKLIDKVAKKWPKFLSFISIISIIFGYIFMFLAVFFLIVSLKFMYNAITLPKAPPIMPVIPYFTSLFKIKFLPPLYFTYWIIILIIIAVSHEFSHGIFARLYGIKIKSTGFGFLGPFIAAFVEPDEKKMYKKKIKKQLAILSAGSFANFVVGILFIFILQLFFIVFYTPVGVGGWFYALDKVNFSNINSIHINGKGNLSVDGFVDFLNSLNESNSKFKAIIYTKNNSYILESSLAFQEKDLIKDKKFIIAYLNSPAYKNNLSGAIMKIDGNKINSIKDIGKILTNKKPGDKIIIETFNGTNVLKYNITLTHNPKEPSKPFLGIAYANQNLLFKFFSFSFPRFDPYLVVKPKYESKLVDFIKDLFYWIILIAISVALFNMLPFSFLDGGRVSYLTFLAIFKKKRTALKFYHFFNLLILIIIFLMFIVWAIRI